MRKRVAGGSKSRPGGVRRATDTNPFPRTRYQGSKRKIAGDIVERLRDLTFTTVLDAFGGTGSVSYALKREGRHVTFNDVLAFNHQIGLALIENDGVTLDGVDVKALTVRCPNVHYEGFIARTFGGIYFTHEENAELD
ncbi:MAG: DNA adenine methylase, partial [Planctomycetes bacterium]|nr:DNA adenine methylase [Planctomycetota bacterium]